MSSELMHILRDQDLVEELLGHLESDEGVESLERSRLDTDRLKSTVESVASGQESEVDPGLEAIIRKFGRPVLFIQDGEIQEPELPVWKKRLAAARPKLKQAIPSIGRIELRGHPRFPWVGTGWLVAPRVVVTNRHVAVTFGRRANGGFDFRLNPVGRRIRARIDFFEEHERASESEFAIKEILHIEEESPGHPDMALLRVASRDQDDQPLPPAIQLSDRDGEPDQVVGAIGYAAWDGDRNDREVMDRIFDGVYEVKRLHPGEVMEVRTDFLNHDCSTLGGNSGSALLDFESGKAVALHYAGRYEKKNYAVKASTVRQRLADLGIDPEVGV